MLRRSFFPDPKSNRAWFGGRGREAIPPGAYMRAGSAAPPVRGLPALLRSRAGGQAVHGRAAGPGPDRHVTRTDGPGTGVCAGCLQAGAWT